MSTDNKGEWKEFDEFYSAHELQLFGMSFPKELAEKLYFKLKNEIFDMNNFFEIMDNPNEQRYLLRTKKEIKKNDHVFLVDHAWTYRLRQYSEFCKTYPTLIKRCTTMLKYGAVKKDVINLQQSSSSTQNDIKKDLNTYNNELVVTNRYDKLDYDEYDITDDTFESSVKVNENTITLSLDGNKIENIYLIYELLDKYKNIKALWISDNPFCDVNENYEQHIYETYPNIEILNRKFTPNAGEWAIKYLLSTDNVDVKDNEWVNKYSKLYGYEHVLDLSGRDPFIMNSFDIIKQTIDTLNYKITALDISDNEYSLTESDDDKETITSLIKLLHSLPTSVEHIIIDDNDDILDMENDESGTNVEDSLFTNRTLLTSIQEQFPHIKYINGIDISILLQRNTAKKDLIQLKRENWVHKYMWNINRTYRLITSEKFDEEPVWYINDEFGSAINHSDLPNAALFPIIFSKDNTFEKESVMTYSILWIVKDVKKGEEIYVDYLKNISEKEERSARLTTWFNTPKEYFLQKFYDKMRKYAVKDTESVVTKYNEGLNTLITKSKEQSLNDDDIKQVYNFSLCGDKTNLIQQTITKIKRVINDSINNNTNTNNNIFLSDKFSSQKIKVATDLPYVRNNLTLPQFEFVQSLEEADIIWLNSNIFSYISSNNVSIKPHCHLNQFPYESVITLKSHLTDLIQNNGGLNNLINLSYDMQTELAELIGNYYYNKENSYDNSWILKPINMSRSMDMTVTDNLSQIIRSVETGPKICQKYLHRPFLMNDKKFDLRFIICLKKLVPLELYFYSKMFWIRSANKNFTMDSSTFDDYEVHFTVMNYNTFGMQTIYNTDFVKYLTSKGIEWDGIYAKIKKQIKDVFVFAAKDCAQMINENSRAIYGVDAMIDENLEPRIIEINFQPDCTRACKFVPEFYNDLFSTLFLDKDSGVELI